jgi:hypothetical protein
MTIVWESSHGGGVDDLLGTSIDDGLGKSPLVRKTPVTRKRSQYEGTPADLLGRGSGKLRIFFPLRRGSLHPFGASVDGVPLVPVRHVVGAAEPALMALRSTVRLP